MGILAKIGKWILVLTGAVVWLDVVGNYIYERVSPEELMEVTLVRRFYDVPLLESAVRNSKEHGMKRQKESL